MFSPHLPLYETHLVPLYFILENSCSPQIFALHIFLMKFKPPQGNEEKKPQLTGLNFSWELSIAGASDLGLVSHLQKVSKSCTTTGHLWSFQVTMAMQCMQHFLSHRKH